MNIYFAITLMTSIICESLSKDEFIVKTMNFINKEANVASNQDQESILSTIYDVLGSRSRKRLLLFTAAAIHNTGKFTDFVDYKDNSIYKSRGLLQIQGRDNYEILTNNSKHWNYLEKYEMLSSTCPSVIEDCKLFFENALNGKYTFENYIEKFLGKKHDEIKNEEDIKSWKSIYDCLAELYLN